MKDISRICNKYVVFSQQLLAVVVLGVRIGY